ncbi:MAG: peptidase [Magnetococcales bacterium]|nr:peptidase [Magnetococcales bacterium]
MKPIVIFRPGQHTDQGGATLTFTEGDLSACVAAYDPATHEAPLVVGHPQSNHPAYGWVEGLSLEGGRLLAHPRQVDPAFAEMVNAGRFKKVSASFYTPKSPINPKPGTLYLRHVGFLGAQPPAIKGLGDASFADGDEGVVTLIFSEPQPEDPIMPDPTQPDPQAAAIAEREKALAAKEAAFAERESKLKEAEATARKQAAASFAEGLAKDGRLLPRHKEGVVAFLESLPAEGTISFAEDGKPVSKPSAEWFRDFLGDLPVQVHYGEFAGPDKAPPSKADPAALAAAAQAWQFAEEQAGRSVTIVEAVQHVMGGAQ